MNTVCGTLLYLSILSLVLNLLLIAGLAICLTPRWVVARMVSSALFREIFQFFASVAGDSPCLFVVLVNDIVLLDSNSSPSPYEFRVGSMSSSIADSFDEVCTRACSDFKAHINNDSVLVPCFFTIEYR